MPREVEEAALVDGANKRQRLRNVTLPAIKPALFLVITLGLIGTWQVFDQIYVMSKGAPAKTTLTPAFLSFSYTEQNRWGTAAAMAFLLFAIIVLLTGVQRYLMRDKDLVLEKKQQKQQQRARRDSARGTFASGGSR